MALPHGVVGWWSAVCDCGISLPILTCFFKVFGVTVIPVFKRPLKNRQNKDLNGKQ